MPQTPVSFLPSPLNVSQTALAALRYGISFIPIVADGTKRPAVRWKDYQKTLPTPRDARQWFSGNAYGIAFLTGQVSGGLEMLDFDSYPIYEQFVKRMRLEGLAWLVAHVEQGYTERSPRGMHLYYRCPASIEGNKKVAQHPLQESPGVVSVIETRGEGGYSIGAPSCGAVHPSGKPYLVQSGSLATIQTIRPEERALLLSVARTLDEMPLPEKASQAVRRSQKRYLPSNERRRPGSIFNEQATWPTILEPHGWTWVKRIGDEDFWRRPGKVRGISATTNYDGSDFLYVFTSSTLLPPQRGIDKFGAYTFLEHNGDFSAATKALVAQGYTEEGIHTSVR